MRAIIDAFMDDPFVCLICLAAAVETVVYLIKAIK